MRILSQDGTLDVPYDMVVIQRFMGAVYCLNKNLTGVEEVVDDLKLAEYSTEAKAIKVMKMINETYIANETYKMMAENQRALFLSTLSKGEAEKTFGIFRFPKDNEIEVETVGAKS